MASKTVFACDNCGRMVKLHRDFYELRVPFAIRKEAKVSMDNEKAGVPLRAVVPPVLRGVEAISGDRPLELCSRGCVHDSVDRIGGFSEASGIAS